MPQTTGLGRFLQTVTTAWRLIMKCTLNQFIKATKSVKPCNSAVIEFQAARPMTNENTFLRISLLVAVCLRVGVKKFLAEIDLTKTHLWHTSLVKKAGRLVMWPAELYVHWILCFPVQLHRCIIADCTTSFVQCSCRPRKPQFHIWNWSILVGFLH